MIDRLHGVGAVQSYFCIKRGRRLLTNAEITLLYADDGIYISEKLTCLT